MLLFDAVALGLLRRVLLETLGVTGVHAPDAFDDAHGWRTADTCGTRSGLVQRTFRYLREALRLPSMRLPIVKPLSIGRPSRQAPAGAGSS